jgi:hypothetical protein
MIPADVAARFTSAAQLADDDRHAALQVAAEALASFQSAGDTKLKPKIDP